MITCQGRQVYHIPSALCKSRVKHIHDCAALNACFVRFEPLPGAFDPQRPLRNLRYNKMAAGTHESIFSLFCWVLAQRHETANFHRLSRDRGIKCSLSGGILLYAAKAIDNLCRHFLVYIFLSLLSLCFDWYCFLKVCKGMVDRKRKTLHSWELS